MWRRSASFAVLFFSSGCAPTLPPDVRLTSAETAAPPEGAATVTFFWAKTSCDPSGHYVIASDRGVVAKVARGHRAIVAVAPGERVFWTWNPSREAQMGHTSATDVALARIHARPGQRYFVQLAFGEWSDSGPLTVYTMYRGRISTIARRCVSSDVALVAIGSRDPSFLEAERVADSLPALTLEGKGGHDRDALEEHRALAEARFARLRPEARTLAVVEP